MSTVDNSGARGSNAGDSYHELWSLMQALKLLNWDTDLQAITVEGIPSENSNTLGDPWRGVDTALIYGGNTYKSASGITIAQLKYSSASPNQTWTVKRLCKSTKKTGDNSVFNGLAQAFKQIDIQNSDITIPGKTKIRLVSNQAINREVLDVIRKSKTTLSPKEKGHRVALKRASKLNERQFQAFLKCLDFSECGNSNRARLTTETVKKISEWSGGESKDVFFALQTYIKEMMLPVNSGIYITEDDILARCNIASKKSLFPSPRKVSSPEKVVDRSRVSEITDRIVVENQQHFCIHGAGGIGKTTAIKQIQRELPEGSILVHYDSYGGGTYLDSSRYRHTDAQAVTQICNDLARSLSLTPFIPHRAEQDFHRTLRDRIEIASEVLSNLSEGALLLLVIDAADNLVTAATRQAASQRLFLPAFLSMQGFPPNVKFCVTSRSSRLPNLKLPEYYERHKLLGFDLNETSQFCENFLPNAPSEWIKTLHSATNGIPRLLHYIFETAKNDANEILRIALGSSGQLDTVFTRNISTALSHLGDPEKLTYFCALVSNLARPIPIATLGACFDSSDDHIRDIVNDLNAGITLSNDTLSLTDEDFESFLAEFSHEKQADARERIAEVLYENRNTCTYAAENVADALYQIRHSKRLLSIQEEDISADIVNDVVKKKNIMFSRLRAAMKICSEQSNHVGSMLALSNGALALKGDDFLKKILTENPRLTSHYAAESWEKYIFNDHDQLPVRGRHLLHKSAYHARQQDYLGADRTNRQYVAWQNYRAQKGEKESIYGWNIEIDDIVASTEAYLRRHSWQQASNSLRGWTSDNQRHLRQEVIIQLVHQLLAQGERNFLEGYTEDAHILRPWRVYFQVPLISIGELVPLSEIEEILIAIQRILVRTQLASPDNLTAELTYHEHVLSLLEQYVTLGGKHKIVGQLISCYTPVDLRKDTNLSLHDPAKLGFLLRSYTLSCLYNQAEPSAEEFLIPNPPDTFDNEQNDREKKKAERQYQERRNETLDFIKSVMAAYQRRTKCITDGTISDEHIEALRSGFAHNYARYSHRFEIGKLYRIYLQSLTRLVFLSQDRALFLDSLVSMANSKHLSQFGEKRKFLDSLSIFVEAHEGLVAAVDQERDYFINAKMAATDKVDQLLAYAQILSPVSYHDAEHLFESAISIAEHIDYESIYGLQVMEPISEKLSDTLPASLQEEISQQYFTYASIVASHLEGYEGLPWRSIGRTLANIDSRLLLSSASRWDDEGLADCGDLLSEGLIKLLRQNRIDVETALSLFPVIPHQTKELQQTLLEGCLKLSPTKHRQRLLDLLARDMLLYGEGARGKENGVSFNNLASEDTTQKWLGEFAKAAQFHSELSEARETYCSDENSSHLSDKSSPSINWEEYSFLTSEEIAEAYQAVENQEKGTQSYISSTSILKLIWKHTAPKNRVGFLTALISAGCDVIYSISRFELIIEAMQSKTAPASFRSWLNKKLPEIIANYAVDLAYNLTPYQSESTTILEQLIALSTLDNNTIATSLIICVERNVDAMSASKAFTILGILVQFCDRLEVEKFASQYLALSLRNIPSEEQEEWMLESFSGVPNEMAQTRFVFALMTDIDTRTRWRASHALRRLLNYSENPEKYLPCILSLFSLRQDPNYRRPDATYYWMSGQTWLTICLFKVAYENSPRIIPLKEGLLAASNDDSFPHVLVREYLKRTLIALLKQHPEQFNAIERCAIADINTSHLPKETERPEDWRGLHGIGQRVKEEDRRFKFDPTDTIPYWYNRAHGLFHNVSPDQFLDVAEKWIVDEWGHIEKEAYVTLDVRVYRSSHSNYSLSNNRHGTNPVIEPLRLYLEWHSMFCAVGDLLSTHALLDSEDEYDKFESWLNRKLTVFPLGWLADFLCYPPLDPKYWEEPTDVDTWVHCLSSDECLQLINTNNNSDHIVVNSYQVVRSSNFRETISISSALVNPEKASALLRALQTVNNKHDYLIPSAGNDLEIDSEGFKLIGWLHYLDGDGYEENLDPLTKGIRGIETYPSKRVSDHLRLSRVNNEWLDPDGKIAFYLDQWGDNTPHTDNSAYGSIVGAHGDQFFANINTLKRYLSDMEMDLILEVSVTRRDADYGNTYRNEEKETEVEYDRLFCFRSDGSIETAEKCVGTW